MSYLAGFTHPEQRRRYALTKLTADTRPKFRYEYWVTGRGWFPYDMLRWDQCWPATGDDAAAIRDHLATGPASSIKMRSYQEPTVDRWSSFGWTVSEHDLRL